MKFKFKIGTRIYLGFCIVLTLFIVSSAYLSVQVSNLGKLLEASVNRQENALAIKDILNRTQGSYLVIANGLLHRNLNETRAEFSKVKNNAIQDLQQISSLVDTDQERALAEIFSDQYRNYLDSFEKKVFPLLERMVEESMQTAAPSSSSADEQKLHELADDLLSLRTALMESLSKISDSLFREMREANQQVDKTRQQMIWQMLFISILGIIIAGLIGFFITRSVTRPLEWAIGISEQVAQGDLTQEIHVASHDETGRLLRALRAMTVQLKSIVGEVIHVIDTVTNAAEEVAQGSTNLAQRTEEQASALAETAASIEELTSTMRQSTESSMEQLTNMVKQSTDNAHRANQLAAAARAQAEEGGQVVDRAVVAMSAINHSSRKISEIIGVIDEIAFQTNLLALNAAVEAARAGEQGRGFAVVAGEVRKLAQRSANAAKEIKTLITDSTEKVAEGSRLVEQSGQTLREIFSAVQKVNDIVAAMADSSKQGNHLVEEITAAAREQTAGIEQINKAILQMDQVTQQNAALVEEAAAASSTLRDQAQELYHLISFFKLEDSLDRSKSVAGIGTVAPQKSSGTTPSAHKGSSLSRSTQSRSFAPKGKTPSFSPTPSVKKPTGLPKKIPSEEWDEF